MVFIVALLACLARWFMSMHSFLGFGVDIGTATHDEGCELRAPEGMVGSEDMAFGRDGFLFIGSSDVLHIVEHGTNGVTAGGIWAFSMKSGVANPAAMPVRLELHGFDAAAHGFHAHGIFVSNATDHLYVVNHAHGYSGIEVFQISYTGDGSLPALQHVSTIGGDGTTFPHRAINDVAEGSTDGNQVYVTQWLPLGLPLQGKKHPASLGEVGAVLAPVVSGLAGLKTTHVYKCERSSSGAQQWECALAVQSRFVGANGITISPDRSRVLVNDPPLKQISVFRRDPADGSLTFEEAFGTAEAVDNIEWQVGANGDSLIMGAIPVLHQHVLNDLLGWTTPVAGSAVVVKRTAAGEGSWGAGRQTRHLVKHDGTKLSQVSSAARWGSHVVMGSPSARGVLVCDMRKTEL